MSTTGHDDAAQVETRFVSRLICRAPAASRRYADSENVLIPRKSTSTTGSFPTEGTCQESTVKQVGPCHPPYQATLRLLCRQFGRSCDRRLRTLRLLFADPAARMDLANAAGDMLGEANTWDCER
jgi:hypothetical protein